MAEHPAVNRRVAQVASVGLSEAKAKEMGLEVRIGKFPFTACAKSHALGDEALSDPDNLPECEKGGWQR